MLSTGKPRNSHSPLTLRAEGNNCRNQALSQLCAICSPDSRSTSDIGVFHQLGSGVPLNPFAKSELLY
jgi:hypothetical protein